MKIAKGLGFLIVLCFAVAISFRASAQSLPEKSTEETYRSLRFHEAMWKAEPPKFSGQRGMFIPDSENFEEMFRLRRLLEARSMERDAAAMFYVAVLRSEAAAKYEKGSEAARREYAAALELFKQAGAGGGSLMDTGTRQLCTRAVTEFNNPSWQRQSGITEPVRDTWRPMNESAPSPLSKPYKRSIRTTF